MKTFHLPDLGEGLQEAEIVDWHVSPGDQVVADTVEGSLGSHGYVSTDPELQALFIASGRGIKPGTTLDSMNTIDLAPTLAFLLRIPEPEHSQGRVLRKVVKNGLSYKPIAIVALNDFHGQLEPTTRAYDNAVNATVGGGAFPQFDEVAHHRQRGFAVGDAAVIEEVPLQGFRGGAVRLGQRVDAGLVLLVLLLLLA